jgi:hypothetical protein
MGQSTYALMFGVLEEDIPEGVDLWGETGDDGFIGQWETACANDIAEYGRTHPWKSWNDPHGQDIYVPAHPYEGLDIIGFYVAVGASGKAGIPMLEGCALSDVATVYKDAYAAAKERWQRFYDWAASQGVVLPDARLFLTKTEVA